MNKSKIDWCDYTWNPITGCQFGCDYCYANGIANRFGGSEICSNCSIHPVCQHESFKECGEYDPMDKIHVLESPKKLFNPDRIDPYPYAFEPTFHKYRLDEPKAKTKASRIFVCSMADMFGDWIPDEWIFEVFNTCFECPNQTFMFLTKNPERYAVVIKRYTKKYGEKDWENMWFGTTITSQKEIKRASRLLNFHCGYKYVSIEPLLGRVDLNQCELLFKDWRKKATMWLYLDWVIVGAQTGSNLIEPKEEWIRKIVDQCTESETPLFMKGNIEKYWSGELIQQHYEK